jgi:hypothetical protein
MAKKKKSKRDFDWGYAMEDFFKRLKKIRKHITKHQYFVGWEKSVQEIEKAESLYKQFEESTNSVEEEKAWNALFAFLKKNLRSWWC